MQDEYYGVSVSESMIEKVRNYIKNQEIHHSSIYYLDWTLSLLPSLLFNTKFSLSLEKCKLDRK